MHSYVLKILSSKLIRPFWQIFIYCLSLPLFLLGVLIPKDPNIWVFGNSFGFKDNARYLFEYVRKNHPEITSVWIYSNGDSLEELELFYPKFSPLGLWFQYRARIFFVSTGFGDLVRFTQANTKIVQFWHAITIKHILLDSKESLPFPEKYKILNKIVYTLLELNLKRYSLVIASSGHVQKRLMSAFGLPKEKIPVTGYPRHDIILKNSGSFKKRILYAPTWRADIKKSYEIVMSICNDYFIDKINAAGYELWVSIHPLNMSIKESIMEKHGDAVTFISENQDINIELAHCEVLVTDYSSIAIDFSLLRRKVIFFTPDYKEYLEGRGIHSEFKDMINKVGVTTGEDVLNRILDNKSGKLVFTDEKKYFRYHDTLSRMRVVSEVLKLIMV